MVSLYKHTLASFTLKGNLIATPYSIFFQNYLVKSDCTFTTINSYRKDRQGFKGHFARVRYRTPADQHTPDTPKNSEM